jgi:hypothetical protein
MTIVMPSQRARPVPSKTQIVRWSSYWRRGAAAMYGMLGAVPDRSVVDGFILDFMDSLDRAE